jgi:colicin import membrane protein
MINIADILNRLENAAFIRRLFGLLPGPLQRVLDSQRNLVYAVLVHVLFLSIFVVSFDWSAEPTPSKPKVNIIDAVVVDESRVQAEIEKLKKSEQQRQLQDDKRQRQLQKEERDLAELKKKQAVEQRRLQEQQKQRKVEEKEAKALALKKKAEKEMLDKLKQEQAALKKEQQALEMQRQQEQKQLAELEKQRQQEAERQLKQQQREEAERALQEQLMAEQHALEAERQRQSDRVVNQYVEIIKQKIQRNWLRPAAARQGLSCTIAVNLMPGGGVLNARVIKSSGDPVFDRSVESAVLKASPLPLPPDAALFERFRELEFIFNPEG